MLSSRRSCIALGHNFSPRRSQDGSTYTVRGSHLFYYAGHGSEIYAPEDREREVPGSTIQVLVPHDYCSESGLEVPGIPDRIIGSLLDEIAHIKGNNIVSFPFIGYFNILFNRIAKDGNL